MNNFEYFNQHIKSRIPAEVFYKYSTDTNGQFGDLQRIEFESPSKIGGIDFWSTGWINMHLVDTVKGDELLNVLLAPNEGSEVKGAFEKMLSFFLHE